MGGNASNIGWKIIEDDSYDLSVAQLGTHEFFDQTLELISYALFRNPTGFPEVPGYPGFHIAKTKLRVTATEIIFSYRLLFGVDIHSRTVIKLRIEIASPEDMGIGDTLNDPEDDIPF